MRYHKPKVLYGASVNLSGLYSKDPIKCVIDDRDERGINCWWGEGGNFDVHGVGEDTSVEEVIRFADPDIEKVRLWIKGARAVMSMLRQWSME